MQRSKHNSNIWRTAVGECDEDIHADANCLLEQFGLQIWGALSAVEFPDMGELAAGVRWQPVRHVRRGQARAMMARRLGAVPARLRASSVMPWSMRLNAGAAWMTSCAVSKPC